jgi:hypothetical protein
MTSGLFPVSTIALRAPGRARGTPWPVPWYGIRAYAVHFETQMHRGIVRKLLYNSCLHFARAGAILFGLDPTEIM